MNITEKTIQEKFQELLVAQRTRFAQEATESILSKLASKAAKAKYPHHRDFLLEHIEIARKEPWIVAYTSSNKGKCEYYIIKIASDKNVSGTALARFKTREDAQALCDQHNIHLHLIS
jgi:hypothetical protein